MSNRRAVPLDRRQVLALGGFAAAMLPLGLTDDAANVAAVLAQWLATEQLVVRGRRASGVRLLEEGLVQTTWTALLRSRDLVAADLWSTVPATSRPHLVLHLDVPPDLAAYRLASRSSQHSRVQRVAPRRRVAELRRGQALLDEILQPCPVRVHHLPSYGETAEELADSAASAVHALVRDPH